MSYDLLTEAQRFINENPNPESSPNAARLVRLYGGGGVREDRIWTRLYVCNYGCFLTRTDQNSILHFTYTCTRRTYGRHSRTGSLGFHQGEDGLWDIIFEEV